MRGENGDKGECNSTSKGRGAGHKIGEGRWEIQACTYKINKSQE